MKSYISKVIVAFVAALAFITLQMPYQGMAAGMSLQKLSESPLGEGTTLLKYRLVIGGKASNVFVTKVDLNNPYTEVGPIYGTNGKLTVRQNVKKMADERGAIAAINADFFRMDRKGAPFGIVLDRGKLVSSMGKINNWYSFGLLNDKTAIVSHLGFKGTVQAPDGTTAIIQGVNKEEYNPTNDKSHLNKINLYTADFGYTSLGAIKGYEDAVEILVVNDQVKDMRVGNPVGYTIPQGGYVLWGHGVGKQYLMSHFKVGDPVKVTLQTTTDFPIGDRELYSAVGGHMLLVKNGQALSKIPSDYIGGYQPRTAFGVSQDGKTLYMVVVEGPSKSRGVTLDELAQLMKQLGAYNAANLDGGGSTTMVARYPGDTQTTLLNTPKLGSSMRAVPTGLAVFNTAPPGEFANFLFTTDGKTMLGKPIAITVKAYDKHYNPYKLDPAEITWTANPADGTFNKNVFTPKRSGTITITGEYKGVKKSLNLTVASPEVKDVTDVIVSPSPLALRSGGKIDFSVSLKTKTGQLIPASPSMVKASLTPGLGTLQGFTITAGQQNKAGELVVTYKNIIRKVPVSVGTRWSFWTNTDDLTSLSYTTIPASISANGSFRQTMEGEPVKASGKALRLEYNFTGSSNVDMRFAYGRFGSKPLVLPGRPMGMKMWVYGDNSLHWLRAELVDAKGKTHYVDLAKQIDWTDWKEVTASFPADVAYPVSLKSLYVVDEEDSTLETQGVIYFDEFLLEYPAGTTPAPPPPPVKPAPDDVGFTDIKGHWAEQILLEMHKKGIVSGITPTKMGPSLPVTRGQFVTFMDRAFGWTKGKSSSAASPFRDKLPDYAKASILSAVEKKIVAGFDDGTFKADAPITRAQMAVIMHNAIKQGYGNPDKPVIAQPSYGDVSAFPIYAAESIRFLSERGYLSGDKDGKFGPNRTANRAESLVVIDRMMKSM
ncbi:phosphodiester glycosidase family protein [Aneurinibacillus thermoaerophilus]|uniref:phosphodiester glycosidase family protein n=1 Tax=Aneurinibacillus thermoaerophilus TaxID=143495 RepID=UPI002E1C8DBE|nr:phosphodiester glycosidase family protein [Aneurinibacillus thermoaerophilus]